MEKERWRKRDITQDGGGGRKNGVLRARPADSERVEKRCGKCDHSFNLRLAGVNQECAAGREKTAGLARLPLIPTSTARTPSNYLMATGGGGGGNGPGP